jgi:hypothetical protein
LIIILPDLAEANMVFVQTKVNGFPHKNQKRAKIQTQPRQKDAGTINIGNTTIVVLLAVLSVPTFGKSVRFFCSLFFCFGENRQ